jgi:NAD(P)-dependent dehydrogenase (short-subunit alcohol dehydrogenase family)
MANILVTGTSRGIGASIVEALGAHQVIGHSSSRGDDRRIAADLSRPGAAEALWNEAMNRLGGRIDVLVNNAGVFEAAPVDLPHDDWVRGWERTMQINLTASAELCRLAVTHFRETGDGAAPQSNGGGSEVASGGSHATTILRGPRGGRIVNVSSRAAYRGDSPQHWHYAASKAGMIGMTKSIARGFASENILAFAVCPGFTMTGMAEDYLSSRGGAKLLADIPLGRVASVDEVAETVRWLAVDAPPSATGAVIDVNGASYVR